MAMMVLFVVFGGLLLIGTPVAAALAVSTLASALVLGLPEIALVQQMTSNLSSVSLLAIPLFIFAGELMLRGGISERIIALAASLVGRVKRRAGAGERCGVHAVRRRLRFGHCRRVRCRRRDDSADDPAGIPAGLRGERHDLRGAGRTAGAAIA